MATVKEVKSLSAPAVFLDGRRVKVIPNSVKAELPDEIKSRAVSSGGGAIDIVHGLDLEQAICKVSFDVANTGEMAELVQDYKARGRRFELSTLKLVEDTLQLNYDRALLTNRVEVPYEAEGKITLEFMGRYAGI